MNNEINYHRSSPGPMPEFRIGEFHIRPDLNRIVTGDRIHQVEPRLMQILVYLARRPGQVAARSALMDEIWGDVIVSEETLTVAVSELRRILRDEPRSPRYIETIRKGGYRLIMPVEPVEAASVSSPLHSNGETGDPGRAGMGESSSSAATEAVNGNGDQSRAFLSLHRLLLFFSLGVALAAIFYAIQQFQVAPPAAVTFHPGVPFTSYPGYEIYPAISGDGSRVAFAWRGPDDDNTDIYLKQQNTEHALRLTDHPAAETYPAWSPDGSLIAYVRCGDEGGIYVIPSIGGMPRRLITLPDNAYGLSWSPDGTQLAYSAPESLGGLFGIFLLSLDTHESQPLTNPSGDYGCDIDPHYSPDGSQIAFTRAQGPSFAQDICIIPAAGGNVKVVTSLRRRVEGLTWTPDAQKIIFSAAPTANMNLWSVVIDNGETSWLPTTGVCSCQPCLSGDGRILIYEDRSFNFDIWSLDLTSPNGVSQSSAIIASTRSDYNPVFSPDGSQIAFISSRSGSREIWLSDDYGETVTQLTDFGGEYVAGVHWSPDGTQLTFTACQEGLPGIYLIDVSDRTPVRLYEVDNHIALLSWSPDGEWIRYTTGGDAYGWNIWRIHPDGTDPNELGDLTYMIAGQSEDKSYSYCYKRVDWGIWRVSRDTDEAEVVVPGESMVNWKTWDLYGDDIYFVQSGRSGNSLFRYNFITRDVENLGLMTGHDISSLTISPDGQRILYNCTEMFECDLILVESEPTL